MAESVNDICDRCLTLTEKIVATKAIVQEPSRRNREAREDLGDLSRQLSDLCDILDHWRYDAVQNEAAKAAVSIVSPRFVPAREARENAHKEISWTRPITYWQGCV